MLCCVFFFFFVSLFVFLLCFFFFVFGRYFLFLPELDFYPERSDENKDRMI